MNKSEVLKLAKLARIDISDAEAESLSAEIGAILGYVGEVKKVSGDTPQSTPGSEGNKSGVHNVFRDDTNPHESGIHTKKILENAPDKEGDYIKVKKIL